jgi:hypothetical protein
MISKTISILANSGIMERDILQEFGRALLTLERRFYAKGGTVGR